MKITKQQLKRIIKEEKGKLKEYGGRPYDPTVPGDFERARDNPTGDAPRGPAGPDAGSIKAARKALNRALTIFERMGYDEAADHVVAAIEAIDSPEGTY